MLSKTGLVKIAVILRQLETPKPPRLTYIFHNNLGNSIRENGCAKLHPLQLSYPNKRQNTKSVFK